VFIAAAAGNSGNPPGRGNSIIYPAKYASVIAVSATDINDQRPSWSSTGEEVELAAPGVSVYSAWNDADSSHNPQPVCGSDANVEQGCYKYGSGTSMSSPHVAGVAALVFGAGAANNDEVRTILTSTAKDIGTNGKDTHYGYGLVDAKAAVDAVGSVDQLPTIAITNPQEGSTVSGSVLITADASDDNGVISVEFKVDGVLRSLDNTSPYEWTWDTTTEEEGAHVIAVTATDTASQTKNDEVNVTVDNVNDSPVADAGADQTVTDSDGGGEEVTLDGSGSYDPDGMIVSYDWDEGGIWLGNEVAPTFNFSLGEHTVTLTVTDDKGATGSGDVVVTVVEASDISLTATGYKVRGLHKTDLEWSAPNTISSIYVSRDGVIIETTENDGFYTDNIDQRGPATYIYKVCEEGTSNCSNEASITFN